MLNITILAQKKHAIQFQGNRHFKKIQNVVKIAKYHPLSYPES
jgi:hypothetical protein